MVAERKIENFTPRSEDISSAKEMLKFIEGVEGSENIKLVILSMLKRIASGQSVSVLSSDNEVTTTEAARILHVSKGFLLKIVDEGKLPCRKVGSHRRIRVQDILTYKEVSEKQRLSAIEEMSRLSQEIEE